MFESDICLVILMLNSFVLKENLILIDVSE